MLALLTTVLFALTAFCTAVVGFLALGLAMERHWQDADGALSRPGIRNTVQALGALALLVSLLCCAQLRTQGHGFVLWIGCLTAAVWGAIGLLSYRTATAARAVRLASLLAVVSCITAMVLRFG